MTKIFWIGLERRARFFCEQLCLENIYFDYSAKSFWKKKVKQKIGRKIIYIERFLTSLSMVSHIAETRGKNLYIYECKTVWDDNNRKIITRLDLKDKIGYVSEFADIESFPKRFAIKTDNTALIRELVARGKKITWVDMDIVKCFPLFGMLKFENLIINPYTLRKAIAPDGKITELGRVQQPDGTSKCIFPSKLRYQSLLGFDQHHFKKTARWAGLGAYFNPVWSQKPRPYIYDQVMFYNILSITYVVWSLKVATHVKKNHVRKGLTELYASLTR